MFDFVNLFNFSDDDYNTMNKNFAQDMEENINIQMESAIAKAVSSGHLDWGGNPLKKAQFFKETMPNIVRGFKSGVYVGSKQETDAIIDEMAKKVLDKYLRME